MGSKEKCAGCMKQRKNMKQLPGEGCMRIFQARVNLNLSEVLIGLKKG